MKKLTKILLLLTTPLLGWNRDVSSGTQGEPSVRAFPNPFHPARKAFMTFDGIPASGLVRIYSIDGGLLREVVSDGSGRAIWDGRNDRGEDVASGVYIVSVEDKIIKIAVLR